MIFTLGTSFFQARFLGLNLLQNFARFFRLLAICGLPLGGLLIPFGSKMEVRKKVRKKFVEEFREVTRKRLLDLLAPKEEALRPPSSSESCRI